MDMVRIVQEKGFLIGSCSDRPMSGQQAIWDQHNIPVDFVVSKQMLPDVKAKFEADVYYHIGDREDLDKKPALEAGFEFLWPHEAILMPWFLSDGDPGPAGAWHLPFPEPREGRWERAFSQFGGVVSPST